MSGGQLELWLLMAGLRVLAYVGGLGWDVHRRTLTQAQTLGAMAEHHSVTHKHTSSYMVTGRRSVTPGSSQTYFLLYSTTCTLSLVFKYLLSWSAYNTHSPSTTTRFTLCFVFVCNCLGYEELQPTGLVISMRVLFLKSRFVIIICHQMPSKIEMSLPT